MDICHLTINTIDYERRIKNQAESLRNSGYTVRIIAIGKPEDDVTTVQNGIFIRRFKTPFYKGGPLKFVHFNLKAFFFLIFKQLDILHCHDLWTLPSAYFLALFKRFKIIYDAHEYYQGLEIFNRNKVRKRLWLYTEKIAIHKVDILITVSEPIAQLYHLKYPSIQTIEVIRNLPKKEVVSNAQRNTIFPKSSKKTIVYQGHFKPGRGLIQLIEAIAFLNEVHLLLIGGGEIEGELREKIAKLNLQNKISLMGYIPTDQLISVTAGADLGVVLFEKTSINYSHALPNKFFEYIMAGIPILASNLETFSEYINTYTLGMTVNPENSQEIAQTIEFMLSDEDQLNTWKENAIKAAKILNWENESHKMNQIYEKLQK